MATGSNYKSTPLKTPPTPARYRGAALPNAPMPSFYFGNSGGLMAAETFLIGAALTKKYEGLANGFVEPDEPDGYSGNGRTSLTDSTLPGQPIYGKIILGDPNKSANEWTDAQGVTSSYQTVELDCAICTIDFNNQVIKTDIQGLPYSVKEFMSSGDNDITITGIYNSTPGVAPIDFIINLNDLFSAGVAIPVQNYFLNNNNIYWIVIMPGTSLPQEQGGYAYQKFTIKALSDVPPTDTILP